jgi:hypothetical protein
MAEMYTTLTLLLAAGHAADAVVADGRVLDVSKAEQRLEHIHHRADVLGAALSVEACMRRTRLRGESERLVDGQRREVYVVLGRVHQVAAVVLRHRRGREGVVADVAMHGVVLAALVGKRLEERRAATARAAEDNCRGT